MTFVDLMKRPAEFGLLFLETPPAALPLTVEELKAQARVEDIPGVDVDAILLGYLRAAMGWIDGAAGWLGRAIITQTWELKLDAFPWAHVRVPLPPLQAVNSVEYIDTDGNPQTLPTSDYTVAGIGSDGPGRIVPAFGAQFPRTRAVPEAVTINFTAGYGPDGAAVPDAIKQALYLLTTYWYDHRDAAQGGEGRQVLPVPFSVNALLTPLRVWP